MKLFVSYTSADRAWAHWIGWQLKEAGHEAFLHEWEVGAGHNIPRWMEERIDQADHLIGVFSNTYCEAICSRSERWSAYWDDPEGRVGFLIPIEVVEVQKWPRLIKPLNRLSLLGLTESSAVEQLRTFLEPRKPPEEKPAYPGNIHGEPAITAFTKDSEPLGAGPPNFPAGSSIKEESAEVVGLTTPQPHDLDSRIHCIDDYEPKPQIFGRQYEVEKIVEALLAKKIALVAGGPGMGKTAVATAALYDPRIVAYFGPRRIFASLETASEPRAIAAKIVEALGIQPTGDEVSLLRIVEAAAAEKPFAAILDNAETVFDANRSAAERLLNLVAQIKGLSLVVTIRGISPHIPDSVQIEDIAKLNPQAAQAAFLAVAGGSFESDPDLLHLLGALDGHVLSIRLVAAQAIGASSLAGLRESWDEAHAEILRASGEEESRLTSVRASLALSLNSRRMKTTPLARRLVALLAYLPAGLAESDVRLLLGERGFVTKVRANDAVVCLHQLRLVERRLDRRLRTLNPLRESIKENVRPLQADQNRLIERYIGLATKGSIFGKRLWEQYREEVEAEADNLDSVCELAAAVDVSRKGLENAFRGLKELYVLSGRGSVSCISRALDQLRNHAPSRLMAYCTRALGDVANTQRNFETARNYYNEAIRHYRRFGKTIEEADCIFRLSSIAETLSDHSTALAKLSEVLALGQKLNSVHLIASSTSLSGRIALRESKLDLAAEQLLHALTLFQKRGESVGEAGCLQHLAVIAQRQSNYELAETRLAEAQRIYHRIGLRYGEANCIVHFGNLARIQHRYESAVDLYEDSLSIFQGCGNIEGEAEATIRLGQIQVALAKSQQGLSNIENGFSLYFKNTPSNDRALPGWKALHRSFILGNESESREHREQARSSWIEIGRLDLVADWVD